MQVLIKEGLVSAEGRTSQRSYKLVTLTSKIFMAPLDELKEDRFWRQEVGPFLAGVRDNVLRSGSTVSRRW